MFDPRQLWQSKKGLSFLAALAAIIVLAVLGIIFKQSLAEAYTAICTLLGLHQGAQGAVDWQNAKQGANQAIQTSLDTGDPAPGEADVSTPYEPSAYQDYRPDAQTKLSDEQATDMAIFAKHFSANQERYGQVALQSDVPTILLAAIHWREADGSFSTYLQNGDPLGKPTTHVPKGILYRDWNLAAVDAIKRETKARGYSGITHESTDFESMCNFAEAYNGFGYKRKGVPSPYVFAGTTGYVSGKYVDDGVYSASAVDDQLGVLPMLREIGGVA